MMLGNISFREKDVGLVLHCWLPSTGCCCVFFFVSVFVLNVRSLRPTGASGHSAGTAASFDGLFFVSLLNILLAPRPPQHAALLNTSEVDRPTLPPPPLRPRWSPCWRCSRRDGS